jgi:hypothetical protein
MFGRIKYERRVKKEEVKRRFLSSLRPSLLVASSFLIRQ